MAGRSVSQPVDWKALEAAPASGLLEAAVAQLVRHERFNWVGVYWVEGQELVLKSWVGPEATEHVRIPIGMGICGLAARTGSTVNVGDVNADPRYLACFANTRSELVVPIKAANGKVLGEIDIDSDTKGEFPPADVALVERVAQLIGRRLSARSG
jgi:L-methionine (R)-S-oxide reductase